MKKVYCAGPCVFLPDEKRAEVETWLRQKLAEFSLEAIFPVDANQTDPGKIRDLNLIKLEESDAVLADLRPFRGSEPDAGTVYECAWASCLGLSLAGYAGKETYKEVVERRLEMLNPDAQADGADRIYSVEDFGLHCNLMLGSRVFASPIEAIQSLHEQLGGHSAQQAA